MRGGRGRARRSASRCDGAATVSRARCVSKSDPSRAFRNLPLAPRRAGHIFDAQGGSRGGAPGRQGLSAAMTPRLSVRLPVKRRAKIKPSQLVFELIWSASFSIFVVETQLWTVLHARHQNRCRACVVNRRSAVRMCDVAPKIKSSQFVLQLDIRLSLYVVFMYSNV